MRRHAVLIAFALLVLTGCGGAARGADTADSGGAAGGLTFREAKLGFAWTAAVGAPSLTGLDGRALLKLGQDVCNDLGRGDLPAEVFPAYARHYGVDADEAAAVVGAAAEFLCPEYGALVGG